MTIKNNIVRKVIQPEKARFHWFVIICIIFCELLMYTWVRTESTQTILQISSAQKLLEKKISYQKELSVERGQLKSDDRITTIARTQLNLISDTLNQTIYFPTTNNQEKTN